MRKSGSILQRAHPLLLATSILLPGGLVAQCIDDVPDPGFYGLKKVDYFPYPRADIRAPTIYAQVMPADTVPAAGFSDGEPFLGQSESWQAEAGFGGDVPVLGYLSGKHPCPRGFEISIYSSAHTLLRMSNSDIVNTDFAFGGAFSFRLGGLLDRVSGRIRFRHESTHLGDEFTLNSAAAGTLKRYNVSTESVDAFLAIDTGPEFADPRVDWYARAYAGAAMLWGSEEGASFDYAAEGVGVTVDPRGGTIPIDSLWYDSPWEFHLGGEWFSPPFLESRETTSGRFFLAGEFYWRDRLDRERPGAERIKSWFAGIGWIFTGLAESSELEVSVRFYRGIHPHGQFRAYDNFQYWAIRLGFNP